MTLTLSNLERRLLFTMPGNVPGIRRTDDDLDHLDPNPPLGYVVQDLYAIDAVMICCARSVWYRSNPGHLS